MAMDSLVTTLQNLEVFRGIAPEQLAEIVRKADRMVFRPGQTLIEAGHQGDGAYVLVAGDAEVLPENGRTHGGQPVQPGSLVGEMAMLVEHEYRITVVARSSIRALKITREQIHAQMQATPGLAEHFIGRISSRLSRVAVELRRIDQLLVLAAEPGQASHHV